MFRSPTIPSKIRNFWRKKCLVGKQKMVESIFFPPFLTFYRFTKTAWWYFVKCDDLKVPHTNIYTNICNIYIEIEIEYKYINIRLCIPKNGRKLFQHLFMKFFLSIIIVIIYTIIKTLGRLKEIKLFSIHILKIQVFENYYAVKFISLTRDDWEKPKKSPSIKTKPEMS